MFDKKVWIKGAGDLASGIALRLHRSGFKIVMTDIETPTTVRRTVAFSPAVYLGRCKVEDAEALRAYSIDEAVKIMNSGKIALLVDENSAMEREYRPDIVIDAIIAKKNLGTEINEAETVIAAGPGFCAGRDCHAVIETKRGHNLGRVIWDGEAAPNTGVPGVIGGYSNERIIRAVSEGEFKGRVSIGDIVKKGDIVGYSGREPVYAAVDGVVRGLLQDGVYVYKGMKSGDIDPRACVENCFTVSDKASAIGGGVLEAILACMKKN